MMESMLVTGAAGFIGGAFVRRLVERGESRVVNLDLLTYAGNLESLTPVLNHDRHLFVRGDIRDTTLVAGLLNEHRPNSIVHFAAESHVDRSIGAPATFVETNVVGTQKLLECARGYWSKLDPESRAAFRFLHVSTDEVYGSLGPTGKFTEQTAYAPNSPYAASKAAADHLVRAYHRTYGLPVLTSNCSNNYGPYQFPEKLIPLMISNAIAGRPLPVYGDGGNIRDWLHVEDHCAALEAMLEHAVPGAVYNIGGDAERSNLQVVERICQAVDDLCPGLPHRPCRSLIDFVPDRPGHDQRYAIDSSRIRRELGWAPVHDFETGLRETVKWYLANQAWVQHILERGHRPERLGLINDELSPDELRRKPTSTTKHAPTYVEGPIEGVVFTKLKPQADARGWLIELFRMDQLDPRHYPAMAYLSETAPGIARGPHEHIDQTDCFAFAGPGIFELRLWDARPRSRTYGHCLTRMVGDGNPVGVLVPPGVVHAYRNVGDKPARAFNSPNRLYGGRGGKGPIDEIRHEQDPDSPYKV